MTAHPIRQIHGWFQWTVMDNWLQSVKILPIFSLKNFIQLMKFSTPHASLCITWHTNHFCWEKHRKSNMAETFCVKLGFSQRIQWHFILKKNGWKVTCIKVAPNSGPNFKTFYHRALGSALDTAARRNI